VETSFKIFAELPIRRSMSVSPIPSASPSEFEPPPGLEVDRLLQALQKQHASAQSEAPALLGQRLDQPAPAKVGTRFRAYA
jgi:hypothetical protein